MRQALGGSVPVFFPTSHWQSQMWSVHFLIQPSMCLFQWRPPVNYLSSLTSEPSFAIVVQLLSHVWLFATAWSATCWASLSFIISQNFLKFMSSKLEVPSNHLILSSSSPAFNLPQYQGLYNELTLCNRWPKYWNFSFSISPSNEYSRLISFRIDWFDLLAVQGTLNSLLQHHSSKASILWCSTFFMVQLSHPYITAGKP